MIGMKEQCFGVEIEMTGITREEAAHALANYFGATPEYWEHIYGSWIVKDPAGKEWKLMSDSSIHPECQSADGYLQLDKDSAEGMPYKVEMVTPKLAYGDLSLLQECMRRMTAIGAKVNDSCGLHVHVDASAHNRQSLKNLIGIMYSKEDLLFKALRVNEARAIEWCQKVREPMLKKARTLSAEETPDLTQLENIWYEGFEGDGRTRRDHYNKSRYYALNLHSVFYRGTVEWRCFNSTLDLSLIHI